LYFKSEKLLAIAIGFAAGYSFVAQGSLDLAIKFLCDQLCYQGSIPTRRLLTVVLINVFKARQILANLSKLQVMGDYLEEEKNARAQILMLILGKLAPSWAK